jgi:hypothetical protein
VQLSIVERPGPPGGGGQAGQFSPGPCYAGVPDGLHFSTQYLLPFSKLMQAFCNRGPLNPVGRTVKDSVITLLITVCLLSSVTSQCYSVFKYFSSVIIPS